MPSQASRDERITPIYKHNGRVRRPASELTQNVWGANAASQSPARARDRRARGIIKPPARFVGPVKPLIRKARAVNAFCQCGQLLTPQECREGECARCGVALS